MSHILLFQYTMFSPAQYLGWDKQLLKQFNNLAYGEVWSHREPRIGSTAKQSHQELSLFISSSSAIFRLQAFVSQLLWLVETIRLQSFMHDWITPASQITLQEGRANLTEKAPRNAFPNPTADFFSLLVNIKVTYTRIHSFYTKLLSVSTRQILFIGVRDFIMLTIIIDGVNKWPWTLKTIINCLVEESYLLELLWYPPKSILHTENPVKITVLC